MNPPPPSPDRRTTRARGRARVPRPGTEGVDPDESAELLWTDPRSGRIVEVRLRSTRAFRARLLADGFRAAEEG